MRRVWTYLQAAKILHILGFAPAYLWIVAASHVQPWTRFCVPNNCTAIVPYGLLWYGFYRLISWNIPSIAYTQMAIILLIVDSLVFYTILHYGKNPKLAIVYFISSFFFLYAAPSDLLPFWLGALALFKWPSMIAAMFAKLPIGAPLWVWRYILQVSFNPNNPGGHGFNEVRYVLLGLWIISPIIRIGINHTILLKTKV